ncbi:MAG: three-Cys-motif partner protein TcmP [Desulfarculus sp.]|nr:three-Cys-motif partner protein TcmP [Desulfarculus sp.]
MVDQTWFEEATPQSIVKTKIVSSYFQAWAGVMTNVIKRSPRFTERKLVYIDLFCGPGKYKDETICTPLLVLTHAVNHPELSQYLQTIFNDKNQGNIESLMAAVEEIEGIGRLKFKPIFICDEVGEEFAERLAKSNMPPSLIFLDPWGYKGLSIKLIKSLIRSWGSDCILFFNYQRINRSLTYPLFALHFQQLFGEERFSALSALVDTLPSEEREATIITALVESLQQHCGEFVLPFKFKDDGGNRTSHYLVFVSKAFKGYDLMKGVMEKTSSKEYQGVANFEYAPVVNEKYPLLSMLNRPLSDLYKMILMDYSGITKTVWEIYREHSIGKPYVLRHYKSVLSQLEKDGLIFIKIPDGKRRKGNPGDKAIVTFP